MLDTCSSSTKAERVSGLVMNPSFNLASFYKQGLRRYTLLAEATQKVCQLSLVVYGYTLRTFSQPKTTYMSFRDMCKEWECSTNELMIVNISLFFPVRLIQPHCQQSHTHEDWLSCVSVSHLT